MGVPTKETGLKVVVAVVTGCFGLSSSVFAVTGADYGTRSPRTCVPVRTLPDARQMVALVQCSSEAYLDGYVTLLDRVKVRVGRARPYDARADSGLAGIDVRAPVIPIRGSGVSYVCSPITGSASKDRGRNCSEFVESQARGACWRKASGQWFCQMGEITGTPDRVNQPPPKF